jgi:hypothetical protein
LPPGITVETAGLPPRRTAVCRAQGPVSILAACALQLLKVVIFPASALVDRHCTYRVAAIFEYQGGRAAPFIRS